MCLHSFINNKQHMNLHKFNTESVRPTNQEGRDPLDMILYVRNKSCVSKLLRDISLHRRIIIKRILQKYT